MALKKRVDLLISILNIVLIYIYIYIYIYSVKIYSVRNTINSESRTLK
jgi:hypothetical protein